MLKTKTKPTKYETTVFSTHFYVYKTVRILRGTSPIQLCDWFELCNINFVLLHQQILYNIYSCYSGMRQQ